MKFNYSSEIPLYVQIANNIEDYIFKGVFEEETQVMSTTEIATFYKINPATVLKGMNLLVERNILYKKRGMGLFVCNGAKKLIYESRRQAFHKQFLQPMVQESKLLDFTKQELLQIVEEQFDVKNK